VRQYVLQAARPLLSELANENDWFVPLRDSGSFSFQRFLPRLLL
jgi:hypothetical protein